MKISIVHPPYQLSHYLRHYDIHLDNNSPGDRHENCVCENCV